MSSVSFDRDQLVREMRASVVTMVVAVALYGAFFLWIPAKKAGFPVTVHWGCSRWRSSCSSSVPGCGKRRLPPR